MGNEYIYVDKKLANKVIIKQCRLNAIKAEANLLALEIEDLVLSEADRNNIDTTEWVYNIEQGRFEKKEKE